MFKINRFTLVSLLLVGAYLLSACGGTLPQSSPSEVAPKVLAKEVVFTGIVEAMNGNQWVVSGQTITVDPAAALDPNITVGLIVKVEGSVSADGAVVALKIETSTVSDDNSNDDNSNDVGNSNDDNSNDDANSNDDNGNDDNSNDAGDDDEVFGVVEALSADSVTVNGVTYQFASFTEFKDAIAVGDQVKIHVIVNADGTFSIREIEQSDDLGNDNSNDDNGNDDNSNDDDNGNSNDDDSDDDNSNDDGGDDNSNGSGGNSNDDDDDDDDGNDNGDD